MTSDAHKEREQLVEKSLQRPLTNQQEDIIRAIEDSLTVEEAASKLDTTAASLQNSGGRLAPVQKALADQTQRFEAATSERLFKNHGVINKTARELGITVSALRRTIQRSPRLSECWQEAREQVVDTAENNVFQAVEEGDLKHSWNILKTLGKDRGFTERQERDVQVTHGTDQASMTQLVQMLDRLAAEQPSAVEAEFEVLDEQDRELLDQALKESSAEEPA